MSPSAPIEFAGVESLEHAPSNALNPTVLVAPMTPSDPVINMRLEIMAQ